MRDKAISPAARPPHSAQVLAPFACMGDRRFRLLFILCCTLIPATRLNAQQPDLLRAYLEPITLRLTTDVLFEPRPFTSWLADWSATTRTQLEQHERKLLTNARMAAMPRAVVA